MKNSKIKYALIEYVDNDGSRQFHKVDKVFWLAIIPKCYGTLKDYCGINIGISIPHVNKQAAEKFYDSIFGKTTWKKESFVNVELVGEKRERIPVMVGEANGYEEDMGTSCLFGYFAPSLLASDERPTMTKFGSIKMELIYRNNRIEGIEETKVE